jgi:hypothetical protein
MIEKDIIDAAKADVADEAQPQIKKLKQSPVYQLHVMTVKLIQVALGLSGLMVLVNAALSFAGKEQISIGAFLGAVGGAVTAYAGKEIAKGIIEARNGH